MKIILASASPRRQELLRQIGCTFKVVTSEVEEDNSLPVPPIQLALCHAEAKAVAAMPLVDKGDLIIAADTIVVLDGQVFGKPQNENMARQMLTRLSARDHEVITGIAIIIGEKIITDYCITRVKMTTISAEEIERYIASGEPSDKAGAYAIQGKGAVFISEIHGCYYNVVGLPLHTLASLLKREGVHLL